MSPATTRDAGHAASAARNHTDYPELEDAVGAVERRFAASHPESLALHRRAQRCMPGGNTRTALHFDPFPLYVKWSAGAYVHDVDEHRYLDALGEFSAGLYGHGHPVIDEAALRAMQAGGSNGAPGSAEIRMAELICERFPSIEKVRFCNSGTEANLYAVSLALAATGRSKLICFSGAYHGGVFVFAGGGNAMNAPFDWTVCRYNDAEEACCVIGSLAEDLAAVIVEPMMSNGGCIPATRDFLAALREACSEVGALLIFDEVVTSRMGRSGLGWMHGIAPDMTTLGKYLGAGFSFGAFGGRADLLDWMDPTRLNALPHAGTFNNNVFTMTCGAAGLSKVFTPERADRLFQDGEDLRSKLNAACQAASPCVRFTGCGSVMNVHFHDGPIARPEDLGAEPRGLFKLFHFDLLEAGVYAARRGQFNLSLPMSEADYEVIVRAVGRFLAARGSLIERLFRRSRAVA